MYKKWARTCYKRSLHYLRANAVVVSIFFYTTLFLPSCLELNNRDYRYIETSTALVNLQTVVSVVHEPVLIKAKSDSAAYVQAYINFCLAERDYLKNFQKSGTKAGQPLSFRLLNDESVDIAPSVSFINKELIEKNIKQRIATLELPK
jgi:hypothetical protein